jgi:hypothetical protein
MLSTANKIHPDERDDSKNEHHIKEQSAMEI